MDPDLVNQSQPNAKKRAAFWVHRRDPGRTSPLPTIKGDRDAIGALAVVVQVSKTNVGLDVNIWSYHCYDYVNGKYTERRGPLRTTGTILQSGRDDSRAREKVELTLPGTTTKVGYISLYRGRPKNNGNGNGKIGTKNPNRKAINTIFRWDPDYAKNNYHVPAGCVVPTLKPTNKQSIKTEDTGECVAPPEDDPMEEEDILLDTTSTLSEPEPELDDPAV